MKKIVCILAFVFAANIVFGQEYYFFHNKTKRTLTVHPHRLCVTPKENTNAFIQELPKEGLSVIACSDASGCIFIEVSNNEMYNQLYAFCLASNNVESVSPVFIDGQPEQMMACASRVALKLRKEINVSNLEDVVAKYGYSIASRSPLILRFS